MELTFFLGVDSEVFVSYFLEIVKFPWVYLHPVLLPNNSLQCQG